MDAVNVYCAIIRSVLEYACAVWHCGITKGQTQELEKVQRRCLKMIYPELSYADTLFVAGLSRLGLRRETIVRNLFTQVKNPSHVLHSLLQKKVVDPHLPSTRDSYPYKSNMFRTARPMRSFINYCVGKKM